ncbi:MAG: hypothetical protein JJ971_04625 [Balneolaceae bacterium]|nr:hypothetical protein [Balneolaceae bacterium]MBO6545660.1 hypothetical protein [Balneolaceae bacterium]MBO6647056.1 hypothetical protein [Balneolaceae bacterium]
MAAKVLFVLLFSIAGISETLNAQTKLNPAVPQGENLKVPEGWEIRLDRPMENLVVSSNPDSGDIYFVNMTPGWHVTTGPRAIFWHPKNEAEGDYTISTSLYTFDPKGRDREGFGLFFGGSNLHEEDQEYIYFLIRNTGDYLIKKRNGEETENLTNWIPSDAIVRFTEESESSELNVLSVKVWANTIDFFINDQKVMGISQGDVPLTTDGLFGLRVNHAVNLHVLDLSMSK